MKPWFGGGGRGTSSGNETESRYERQQPIHGAQIASNIFPANVSERNEKKEKKIEGEKNRG